MCTSRRRRVDVLPTALRLHPGTGPAGSETHVFPWFREPGIVENPLRQPPFRAPGRGAFENCERSLNEGLAPAEPGTPVVREGEAYPNLGSP